MDPGGPAIAYLGLGSNLGDRRANLIAAIEALQKSPEIDVDLSAGVAALFETDPVGGPPNQPTYLNSAVRVATALTPRGLLAAVLDIEAGLGRTREQRWEARVIDIDLLLYGDVEHHDAVLTVPHPRLATRRFVLAPLCEIAGSVVHPVLHSTIAELACRPDQQPSGDAVTKVAGPDWPVAR